MATVSNYYEILEVSIDATFEEIKKSFQKKIRQEHPDKSSDENSQKIASKLIEAYKVLSDDNLRSEYNKQYEQQHQKANRGQCFDQINLEKQSNLIDYECEQCGEINTIQIDSRNKDEDFVIVECIGCNLKLQINLK
ncbi:chaperone DnaJ (macronuclear) [Tetrahymena thermophila SB210]|uniref:Chaperone DnaJ n=1 Tax=Tetrahymena thermophila (strain SB210) TaxID=312017 RepID=Q23JL8_TETTS|nr:chaperone DnaJ [Tetrahymena thermophila SB210]EAR96725.2 chaperone DnaJ [Tetrahymena thermophila SB210]|eukprot:XP_001016970.2 chaperone DnaJ [Tetrahymena thermophila SB210]